MCVCVYLCDKPQIDLIEPSRSFVGSACHLILNLALILAKPLHLAELTLSLECVARSGLACGWLWVSPLTYSIM